MINPSKFVLVFAICTLLESLLGCATSPARSQTTPSPHTNRLSRESSPYLLQHAHNPVDWYPWGTDAFAKAKRENKPIFLSIGYAACHWCHVMERESFESKETAATLNRAFVCIKVDREERPDVDDIYMSAIQLMTGQGGWPLSVFLLPDGKPFFGGTYFRPDDFRGLLERVEEVWNTKRVELNATGERALKAIKDQSERKFAGKSVPGSSVDRDLLAELKSTFDPVTGGFGKAPKFPPHNTLPVLLRLCTGLDGSTAKKMLVTTLDGMANGGMRDHVGGGFHRYSTDGEWKVPHFEKMLYDNAMLARAYADAYALTKNPEYQQIARDTLDWALREMRGPEGGFYSSLDADSEGIEGKYYVWTAAEIERTLGADDAALFERVYTVKPAGNYRAEASPALIGTNILYRTESLERIAKERSMTLVALALKLKGMSTKLRIARDTRVRPLLDDKRLASWNALMIGSLAHCGKVLGEQKYTDAARAGAEFVLGKLQADGKLIRRWRPGSEKSEYIGGFLEDYAYMITAMIALEEADGNPKWLREAVKLADGMMTRFGSTDGGFFDTPAGVELILYRTRTPFDQATPSANGTAALALLQLGTRLKESKYMVMGRKSLEAFAVAIERAPRGTETLVNASALYRSQMSMKPNSSPVLNGVSGPISYSSRLVETGGTHIEIKIVVAGGYHIQSDKPLDKDLIPTSVIVNAPAGIKCGKPVYPVAKRVKLGFSANVASIYDGTILVKIPVGSSKGKYSVQLRFQACDDKSCLAPVTAVLDVK